MQLHLGPERGALASLPSPPSLLELDRASSRHPVQPRAAAPPTSIPHHPSAPSPRVAASTRPWRQNHHHHPHKRVLLPVGGAPALPAEIGSAAPTSRGSGPGPSLTRPERGRNRHRPRAGTSTQLRPVSVIRDGHASVGKGQTPFQTAAISDLLLCLTAPGGGRS